MNQSTKEKLQGFLDTLEQENPGQFFTLALHQIGTVSNGDITVGKWESRTPSKWRVVINDSRQLFPDDPRYDFDSRPVPMEAKYRQLSGDYASLDEINKTIARLQLSHVTVADGQVYHGTGGRMSIVTHLGTVTLVK
jgi:hypothetical protein